LKVTPAADKGLDVTVTVRNEGKVAGDEVPQVYLDAPVNQPAGVQFSPSKLAAFDRVTLNAGESKTVTMHVPARSLEYWSTAANAWQRAGTSHVRVGSSSRDLKLTADAQP
jgi:beta-glucosidase